MVTKKQNEAINLYAAIMEEAKIRLNSIDMALAGTTILPHQLVREFCFLQLRMLCELIALGCLTAHGDVVEATKLRNEWAADKISDRLEKLNPDFYPQPVKQISEPYGYTLERLDNGSLSRDELASLNGRCGDVLHRGNLKKLLSEKTPIQNKFPDIHSWARKINLLLHAHCIRLHDGNFIICMLRNFNDNNRVQVAFAESSAPPPESLGGPKADQPPSTE
jgi:hypothetical protein